MRLYFIFLSALVLIVGCRPSDNQDCPLSGPGCEYASFFGIMDASDEALKARGVVTLSPSDETCDTLLIDNPLQRIICMSSSSVAALSVIGADSLVIGVSGLKYISDPKIHRRAGEGKVHDVGYEASMDYETIMRLDPDLVLAYKVGDAEPPYLTKLRSLGIPVLVLYDHLEQHPLARAEYVRLFGVLAGCSDKADDFFDDVKNHYLAMRVEKTEEPVRVLMNIPYADAWYLPGSDGYMSRLIRDAGGQVLGAQKGSVSGVITMEDAYSLSLEADMWLCPGYCRTREQLATLHHLFPHFGPLAKGLPIYNNILRTNQGGGNDFWESGAVRPDLILKDLRAIFQAYKKELSAGTADNLSYFIELSE